MGGGVGVLVLMAVALAAAVTIMLLTLNARWKSPAQILQEARENIFMGTVLVLLALGALLVSAFVVWDLL